MTSGTPSRRAVLMAGIGALTLGLSGCYRVSPLIGTGTRTGRTASPPPVTADRRAAVDAETALEGLARQAGLTGVAAVHAAHATVLAQADPLAGRNADTTPVIPAPSSSAPLPSATPHSSAPPASPAQRLLTAEKEAAARYLAVAMKAADPGLALLWAGLSVFCATITASGPEPTVGDVYPVRLRAESPTAARQVLLSRLNALSTGLEWGIGRLSTTDPLYPVGVDRLAGVNRERVELRDLLRAASASPTPLLPGYPMPATPSTPASTRVLWSGLELGALAGWGRVVAATVGADRRAAIGAMSTPVSYALRYGTAVPAWPGWV